MIDEGNSNQTMTGSSNGSNGGGGEAFFDPKSEEAIRGVFGKLRARNWQQTLRPMGKFVAPASFARPRNSTEVSVRLQRNLGYFLTNYLLLTAVIFLYAVISRPLFALILAAVVALWHYALRSDEFVVPNPANTKSALVVLRGKTKVTTLTLVTAVVVLAFGGATIFAVFGVCASLVLLHATLFAALTEEELNAAAAEDDAETEGGVSATAMLLSGGSGSGKSGAGPGGIELAPSAPGAHNV